MTTLYNFTCDLGHSHIAHNNLACPLCTALAEVAELVATLITAEATRNIAVNQVTGLQSYIHRQEGEIADLSSQCALLQAQLDQSGRTTW